MSVAKMAFGIMAASLFFSGIAQAENDLNPWNSAEVEVNVSTFDIGGSSEAQFTATHPYTNTLQCSFEVELPFANSEGGQTLVNVSVKDATVFPRAAFGRDLSSPIALGERSKALLTGFQKTVKARCSGWNTRTPLPREACKVLAGDPTRVCSLLYPGQRTFPVLKNDQYLGNCECP